MNNGLYRLLLICSHPIQYASPVFRDMAKDPRLDILVAYCSLQGAERGVDPGFGVEVTWDVPLFEGYRWVQVPNRSPLGRIERFFGLINPGLWATVRKGNFDAVVAYTGYAYFSFWIALAAAKLRGVPVLVSTDATSILPRDGKRWKIPVKKFLLPKIFGLADTVLTGSTAGSEYVHGLGIPEEKISLTPFAADNEWWRARVAEVDRAAVRRGWQVPEEAPVALFCAKLQSWKRPHDALEAFAKAAVPGSYLVFAGDGPLRTALEAESRALGVAERVRFLGFVNQSGLPPVYRGADIFVLPSEYDPCPVVVCEAMLCECPVALSDQIRGRFDLVRHGQTGYIFPCGDIEALTKILGGALSDRARLREMGLAAAKRMETWSHRENIAALIEAVGMARKWSKRKRVAQAF
jgi:glycosyltransferase involved in cell wall biosynthesis